MGQYSASKFKAILFDKDGTLVDFNGTWLALYEKLALEAADGNPCEAARLLEIGGYDRASNSFLAGSEFAAGTTDTIVRLWIGDGKANRIAFWKARLDRVFLEDGPAAAVPVPGLHATLARLHD
jgi:phosphoglycolate phosphatase